MALLFIDSCGDHYSTAQVATKWSGAGSPNVNAGGGRRSTNSLSIGPASSVGPRSLQYNLAAATQTIIAGAAFALGGILSANNNHTLISFFDGATNQVELRMTLDSRLQVLRNGTVLATASTAYSFNGGGYRYVEFKVKIDNATGTYEVRVDGVNVLSGSGVDTQQTANATADRVFFGPYTTGNSIGPTAAMIDDAYIADISGSAPNNDFLGDLRVDAVLPNAAGNTTDLTPSAGSNFQCVDDNPANDDTDYVEHATVGNKDTYNFTNLSHTALTVFGVQTDMRARKDDAGAKEVCDVIRSAGTDYDGGNKVLTTSYIWYMTMHETDPATAAAWTVTDINAAEFGMKVAA